MAGKIPREFIDELINRVDIVELVDSYHPLKKAGRNFVACCPFHDEKSPSFNVIPHKQFYYCFGCGASGNAISFLLEYERLSFPEAVHLLADKVGMEIPEEVAINQQYANKVDHLFSLMQDVSQFYQQQLRQHPSRQLAVDYLKRRGMSGHIAKSYELGYAPAGWDNLLKQFKRHKQHLTTTGMLIEKDNGKCYDRFRERVMFPIRDRRGRIIGFGGRVLGDDQPKYLNSPETPIFHKGQELYGLYQVLQQQRQVDQFLIVEGYMDVLALAEHSINFAVATLGTATTQQHMQSLLRYSPTVTFCFDGDKAGKAAAWRALETSLQCLQNGVTINFMFLPQGEDPDSLVHKEGQQAFMQRIQQAEALDDYLYRHLQETIDIHSSDGKSRLISAAKPLLQAIPDKAYRHLLTEKLARLVRIASERLEPMLNAVEKPASHKKIQPKQRLNSTQLAIALILQEPQILANLTVSQLDINAFDDESHLLHELIQFLGANPTFSTAHILEHWRDSPQLGELQSLLQWQQQIPESGLAAELTGTLQQVQQQDLQHRIQQMLSKAQTGGLSEQERIDLQALIKASKQAPVES